MVNIVKIKLINGDVREFIIDSSVDYKGVIENGSVIFRSNETEILIPLTSILTFEVIEQE